MNIRRDKRDALFSGLVRERACWVCERCGKKPEIRSLHCSHLFSRRHRATRWHPKGSVAHCFSCHQYLGEHPIEFSEWIKEYLGHSEMKRLRRLSQVVAKFSKKDLAEIEADLKVEIQLMKQARFKGVGGRLEFAAPRAVQLLEDGMK